MSEAVVAAAEAAVESEPLGWRRFRRWTELVEWVGWVVGHDDWADVAPDVPLDVVVERRSRSARFSAAHVDSATIWIRDGSWDSLTVLHELAHLAVGPTDDPHGQRFVELELALVRRFVGLDAWSALHVAYSERGVDV